MARRWQGEGRRWQLEDARAGLRSRLRKPRRLPPRRLPPRLPQPSELSVPSSVPPAGAVAWYGAPEPSGGTAPRQGARRGRRGGCVEGEGQGPRLLLQLCLFLNAAATHPPALAPAARLISGLARVYARLRCTRLGLAASLVHASTSPLASVLAAAALFLLSRGRPRSGSRDSWGHGGRRLDGRSGGGGGGGGGGGWRLGGGGGRRLGRVGVVFAASLVLAPAATLSSAPRARLRGVVDGLHRAARCCMHHACTTMPRRARA